MPDAGLKTVQVNVLPFGAVWLSSLKSTTAAITMMSATVVPSRMSSVLVVRRIGETARYHTRSSARPPMRKPDQVGGFFQMPTSLRNVEPKMPAAMAVSTA